MSTEGEVMDASRAPVTDELTGVHHGPQRDAIYEPEKTARRNAHHATGLLNAETHHRHLHNFTQQGATQQNWLQPVAGAALLYIAVRPRFHQPNL